MSFLNSEWAFRIRSEFFEFGLRFKNLERVFRIWIEFFELGVRFKNSEWGLDLGV